VLATPRQKAAARRVLQTAHPDVVAQVLGVSRATVARWKRDGLPVSRVYQLMGDAAHGLVGGRKEPPPLAIERKRSEEAGALLHDLRKLREEALFHAGQVAQAFRLAGYPLEVKPVNVDPVFIRTRADELAEAAGVKRATVLRWGKVQGGGILAEAKLQDVKLQGTRLKPFKPGKVTADRRDTGRSRVWDATVSGGIPTPLEVANYVSKLVSKLQKLRGKQPFPEGTTFQYVIEGISLHDPHETVKGAYEPIALTPYGGKMRTFLKVPSPAESSLEDIAQELTRRLLNNEAFFKIKLTHLIARKGFANWTP